MNKNIFIEEFKDTLDDGDKWGHTMLWAFALCDWLEDNTSGCIRKWEFKQSCMGSDTDSYIYQRIEGLVDLSSEDSLKDLRYFERWLERYNTVLRLNGLDY